MEIIGKDKNGKDLIRLVPGEWNMIVDLMRNNARPMVEIALPDQQDIAGAVSVYPSAAQLGGAANQSKPPATAKVPKAKAKTKAAKQALVAPLKPAAAKPEVTAAKPLKGNRAILQNILADAPGAISVDAVIAAYAKAKKTEPTREMRTKIGIALCDMAKSGLIHRSGRGLYAALVEKTAVQKAFSDMTDAELRARLKIAAATNTADPEARAEFLRRGLRKVVNEKDAA